MAIKDGQKGFWVKRAMDTNPIFVSVGGTDVPDSEVDKAKSDWSKRSGYSGDMASNNVQWVGEDPNKIYTDIATGNVKSFSPARPNPVEENYFDTALRLVEEEAVGQKSTAQRSYDTLASQLKESRDLFNKNLESEYGKALEQANINVYARGVGDSGIKGSELEAQTGEKEYKAEQQDLLEKQKKEIASQDLRSKLEAISRQEQQSKFDISNKKAVSSPYAKYSYT